MKKILSIIFSSLFLMSTAYAGGMIGIKGGFGDIEGERTTDAEYGAQSASVDSEYGAVFVEVEASDLLSVGLEFIPFTANIGFDGNSSDANAEISDAKSIYLLAGKDTDFGSVYGKIGYFHADVNVTTDYVTTTITSAPDDISGPMIGVGAQFESPIPFINIVRLEGTYTMLNSDSIVTTSNGGVDSDTREGEADIATVSISLAKSF